MKHLKKSLSLFLCIVLCLSLFPFPAAYAEENIETVVEEETVSDVARSAAIHSGTWGNLTWTLPEESGLLTISGNGVMDDFASDSTEAWRRYRDYIKAVEIGSGVTSIGAFAFAYCYGIMTSVTIPESVTSIGASAFDGCFSLTSVTIPENITSIGTYAFYYCKSLKEIRFLGAPPTIGDNAFKSVTATADYPANRGWTAGAMQNYGGNLTWMPFETAPDFILPTGLTVIEEEAFERGAFTYVKLSEITTKIGPRAFADCPNLRYIYIPEATTSIDPNAFGDLSTLTVFGKTGSTAEIFAQTHGFTFVAVP